MNTAPSPWIATKDRLPTLEDADENECVFVRAFSALGDYATSTKYSCVKCHRQHSHWMPIPPLPPKPDAFEVWVNGKPRSIGFSIEDARAGWNAALDHAKESAQTTNKP